MAISSDTRKAGPYIGNGATTEFAFDFKVFTAADVLVVQTNLLGVEIDLVLDTDYSVTLNADQDVDPGGTVTLTGGALAVDVRLTLTSDVPALQSLVLTNNGGFYPRVINDAFDRITIIAQQLIEQVGRSLKLPISSTASATLPDPVANSLIAWNSGADGFANVAPTDLATVAAYADAVIDLFTGDGAETAFTLTNNPAVLANLSVSISGVVQVGGEDFTWIGTTITFTVAPPAGTRIQVRYTRAIPPADLAGAVADAEAAAALTAADRVQTGDDAVATAADRVATGDDAVATAADRVATGDDAVATAADRVQTGLDVAATAPWSAITPGTGIATALAVNVGSAGAPVLFNGAGGTPSSMTLTNATGLPVAGGGTGSSTAADARTALAVVGTSDLAASTGAALVGSIVTGTGATARTVQAKLRDTLTPQDKGAVANGSTNDATALENAAGETTKLTIPAATYMSRAQFDLPANKVLEGGGRGTVITTDTVDHNQIAAATADASVRDLTLTGVAGSSSATSGMGLVFSGAGAVNGSADNVELSGMSSSAVFTGNGATGQTFTRLHVHSLSAGNQDQANASFLSTSSDNILGMSRLLGGGWHGVQMQTVSTGHKVFFNYIKNQLAYGILDYQLTNASSRSLIVGNTIENISGSVLSGNSGAGIYTASAGGQIIALNHVTNVCLDTTATSLAPGGIGLNAPFGPVLVTGNRLELSDYYGLIVTASTNSIVHVADTALIENDDTGLYVKSSSYVNVVGLASEQLTTTPKTAIAVGVNPDGGTQRKMVSLIGAMVRGSGFIAFEFYVTDRVVISGLNLGESFGHGIRIRNGTGATITNSVIDVSNTASKYALLVADQTYTAFSSLVLKVDHTVAIDFSGTCTGSVFDKSNVIVGQTDPMNFINNTATGMLVETYGTAAPTLLAHAVGDRVINRAPVVGNPKAWVCTVAGTPGTWVSEGNL